MVRNSGSGYKGSKENTHEVEELTKQILGTLGYISKKISKKLRKCLDLSKDEIFSFFDEQGITFDKGTKHRSSDRPLSLEGNGTQAWQSDLTSRFMKKSIINKDELDDLSQKFGISKKRLKLELEILVEVGAIRYYKPGKQWVLPG